MESSADATPGFLDQIAEEHGLTNDGPIVYDWIDAEELDRLIIQRIGLN